MNYLLAHDIGTSSVKATLFDEDGRVENSSVVEYPTHYAADGGVEQDPDDWWHSVCEATLRLTNNVDAKSIAGVSFSGHMEGTVCIDKGGRLLHNSLIWADQRAKAEAAEIEALLPDFYTITGHRAGASKTVSKLLWLKRRLPAVYERTDKLINTKDYVIYKLTGELLTDFSDASGTCCMDLTAHEWSREIFQTLGLNIDIMPEIRDSSAIAGYVTARAAAQCGLIQGTPVVCGGGDGVCAGVGAGCIDNGEAYTCMGTSAWIAATFDRPIFDENKVAFNFAHMTSRKLYMPCGAMSACGASFDWFRENVCPKSSFDELSELIKASPAGARGLIFLPYIMGERSPRWNPKARGAFVGFAPEHTRSDMLRAVMEGVALNLNKVLKIYENEFGLEAMTAIGGCASNDWLRICADVYGIRLDTLNVMREAPSVGAAVTAGVGVGLYSDFSAVRRFIRLEKRYMPDEKNKAVYARQKKLFDMAYDGLKDVFELMSEKI